MTFKDLMNRVSEGEVVPVETINGIDPDLFITKNYQHFQHLAIQNDYEKGGVFWIFDPVIRSLREYNP